MTVHAPDTMVRKLAALEMIQIAEEMAKLGETLCGDPDIAARYMVELQAIDSLVQRQRGLAEIVQSTNAIAAASNCTMEALSAKFRGAEQDDG